MVLKPKICLKHYAKWSSSPLCLGCSRRDLVGGVLGDTNNLTVHGMFVELSG